VKYVIVVGVGLSVLGGCGVQSKNKNVSSPAMIVTAPSKETFALGTELTSEGAVSREASSDEFKRGGEVYLSICTAGSSTEQMIEVAWVDPAGNVIHTQKRIAPRGGRYIAFSSGRTAGWRAGEHHAVVTIDGRRVTEKTFALL
jgi:hypothetical protein